MSQLKLDAYANRKPLKDLLKVPERVQSVYSLTQHIWTGESDDERQKSKKGNKVRLETLGEFFLDPVRSYLSRIFQSIAANEGQGFWVQAEFGVGKSHLLAATAVMAVGGVAAWEKVKQREDAEGKAGPARGWMRCGARSWRSESSFLSSFRSKVPEAVTRSGWRISSSTKRKRPSYRARASRWRCIQRSTWYDSICRSFRGRSRTNCAAFLPTTA